MEDLIIALDERLADVGSTLTYKHHIDLDTIEFGDREFSLPTGAEIDVALTNAGEGILVTGIVRADLVGTCDRCLDEATIDVAGEVDEYFLFREPYPLRRSVPRGLQGPLPGLRREPQPHRLRARRRKGA